MSIRFMEHAANIDSFRPVRTIGRWAWLIGAAIGALAADGRGAEPGRLALAAGSTLTVNAADDSVASDNVLSVREALIMAGEAAGAGSTVWTTAEKNQVSAGAKFVSAGTGLWRVDPSGGNVGRDYADTIVFKSTLTVIDVKSAVSGLTLAEGDKLDGRAGRSAAIALDGAAMPRGLQSPALEIQAISFAGPTTVQGLVFRNFPAWGIRGRGVRDCTLRGLTIHDNGGDGIYLTRGVGTEFMNSRENTIGGPEPTSINFIFANAGNGIVIDGDPTRDNPATYHNQIYNSYIGLKTDTSAGGNGSSGIYLLNSPGNTIGGPSDRRNVISANGVSGIRIEGANAHHNQVGNCYIGIEWNGQRAMANVGDGVLLVGGAHDNRIGNTGMGNVISGNGVHGITLTGDATTSNVIQSNIIGLKPDLSVPIGNGSGGIGIVGGANGNTIGGEVSMGEYNIISGNSGAGVMVTSANNRITGNIIGISINSTSNLGNVGSGVALIDGASGNQVGGPFPRTNYISGNTESGVSIGGSSTANNRIQGNAIGTNSGGFLAVPNNSGVTIFNGADNNLVGGSPAEFNLISGNATHGVGIFGSGTTGNTVQGNYIGVTATGDSALGNGDDGVLITEGASASTVQGNVISGNQRDGVRIVGAGTTGNLLIGNTIGMAATGQTAVGNAQIGVRVTGGASGNQVGVVGPAGGNRIGGNGAAGVQIESGERNAIRRNSIFGNAGMGIDLGGDGVTANDAGDTDAGANGLQNYPEIRMSFDPRGIATAHGTLASKPSTKYIVELFTDGGGDPTGHGEGEIFLGSVEVQTNGAGAASFELALGRTLPTGVSVAATATDPDGNTSEFSTHPRNPARQWTAYE